MYLPISMTPSLATYGTMLNLAPTADDVRDNDTVVLPVWFAVKVPLPDNPLPEVLIVKVPFPGGVTVVRYVDESIEPSAFKNCADVPPDLINCVAVIDPAVKSPLVPLATIVPDVVPELVALELIVIVEFVDWFAVNVVVAPKLIPVPLVAKVKVPLPTLVKYTFESTEPSAFKN